MMRLAANPDWRINLLSEDVWSLGRDLNPRPTTYEAAAPTELSYRGFHKKRAKHTLKFIGWTDEHTSQPKQASSG